MKTLLLLAVVAGCAADVVEDELGEVDSEVTSSNKLAANKLAANKLAANKLAANSMKASSLADSDLIDTAEGREVLSYIISCALPAGQSITLKHAYTFDGAIGLAPAWSTRAPTVTERRWVSACVLARTNLYGTRVDLSMRGSHPALAGSIAERLDYLLVEGAFYGDLFHEDGPKLYACAAEVRDLDLALSTQDLRACATSSNGQTTRCGFTYTGKCSVADLSLAPACNSVAFPYQRCRAGRGRNDEIYTEVITVSLATSLWTDAHTHAPQ